jgi:hypothetical protein
MSKRTASVSPGSAPSTKKGPVWGLPRSATRCLCWSWPRASMVVVSTVSPEAMWSTGG